jgi:hypothetical protein
MADWRYPLLFSVQTIGVVILFWNAVPLYRRILADPTAHEARPETLVWAFAAIALIQTGYWIRYRVRPPMPQFTNAFAGHVVRFLGRMLFVLATSLFGFVFIKQGPGFHMPVFRYVVFIVGLFSLFCYTQELNRLGTMFIGPEKKSGD